MIEAMSQIVFLTCHPEMGRRRDRSILRDNQAWAAQIVDHYRSHPHPSGTRFFHQTAEPAGRGEAGVRAGMITAFGAAATAAGPEGTIMLLVGHGSEQMVDLAPAPALRVTEDAVRAAHRYIGNRRAAPDRHHPEAGDEVEALVLLADAVRGRFNRLDLGTCNTGRGLGVTLCGSLMGLFDLASVRGLSGFLWSARVPRAEVADAPADAAGANLMGMGITRDRATRPPQLYGYSIPAGEWWTGRRSHGPGMFSSPP